MIRDKETELRNAVIKSIDAAELNYAAYASEIQQYAEWNYSKHSKAGFLHYVNFEGDNYSIVDSKTKAYIFQYPEDRIIDFRNDFIMNLREIGFKHRSNL